MSKVVLDLFRQEPGHCNFFCNLHFTHLGINTMLHTNDASAMHKQAASDHSEAAKHHLKAACDCSAK
jgi:hypothetical protein